MKETFVIIYLHYTKVSLWSFIYTIIIVIFSLYTKYVK